MSLADDPHKPYKVPEDLDTEELISLVYAIQGYLYVELDGSSKLYWNIDKEVDCADFVEWLSSRLACLGLAPKRPDYVTES